MTSSRARRSLLAGAMATSLLLGSPAVPALAAPMQSPPPDPPTEVEDPDGRGEVGDRGVCRIEANPRPIPVVHLTIRSEGGDDPEDDGEGWTGFDIEVLRSGTRGDLAEKGGEETDGADEDREAEAKKLHGEIENLIRSRFGGDPVLVLYDESLGSIANAAESLQADDDVTFTTRARAEGPDAARTAFIESFPVDDEGADPTITIAPHGSSADGGRSWSLGVEPVAGPGRTWARNDDLTVAVVRDGLETVSCDPASGEDGETITLPAVVHIDGALGDLGSSYLVVGGADGPLAATALAPRDAGVGRTGRTGGDTEGGAGIPDEVTPTTEPEGVESNEDDPPPPAESGGSTSPIWFLLVGLVGFALGAGVLLLRGRSRKEPMMWSSDVGGGTPHAPAAPAGPSYAPSPNPTPSLPVRAAPAPPGWTGAIHGDRSIRLGELGLSRVRPRDLRSGRSWAYEAIGVQAIAGWMEKKPGRGEDAEPTLRLHESGSALLGAYDGTGGAGAAIARRLRDGTELTGAYVSSRLVRELVETWAVRRLGQGPLGAPDELASIVATALRDEATATEAAGGVRGSLSKTLPTTAAVVALSPLGEDGVRAEAIWAGDSRGFTLTPASGLQVLTTDDTPETDALELIRNDQPMQNVISADRSFVLNHHEFDLSQPAVFLVATDGCFGYVATPAHFEFHLLDTMMRAADIGAWSDDLLERLAGIAADDVSYSIAAVGFDDFAALKRAFTDRHAHLTETHWNPVNAETEDQVAWDESRIRSWESYRQTYEALMTVDREVF